MLYFFFLFIMPRGSQLSQSSGSQGKEPAEEETKDKADMYSDVAAKIMQGIAPIMQTSQLQWEKLAEQTKAAQQKQLDATERLAEATQQHRIELEASEARAAADKVAAEELRAADKIAAAEQRAADALAHEEKIEKLGERLAELFKDAG